MATHPSPQVTDFSRDVVGRYVCNGLDEARRSAAPADPAARPFDVVIIGAGTFGSVFAQHLFASDKGRHHRILVLEGGPVLIPEHVQNLPMMGLNVPAATSIADLRASGRDGTPRGEVWGLAWHSPVRFPGLAYCVGGRSLYWGGWSPRPLDSEMPADRWPASLVQGLNGGGGYLGKAAEQLGADAANDFIFGDMHRALRDVLLKALRQGWVAGAVPLAELPQHLRPDQVDGSDPDLSKLEAPLAVQGSAPKAGFFPFNKFSAVPLLMGAARASWFESGNDDTRRRLMVVPHCHVQRLLTVRELDRWRVAKIETNQGSIDLPRHGMVFIALGTIESTRLALNSFGEIPNHGLIGGNLLAHLRSNLDMRIPRDWLPGLPAAIKDLQASALFVKGRHRHADGSLGHFHLQITASGLGPRGSNSEEELFKKVPDVDGFDRFLATDDKSIVITIRGIGEMEPDNPKSFVRLDPEHDEYGVPRAFVAIEPSAKDLALWDVMDRAAEDVAKAFAGGRQPEILGRRRDGLGTTHHEAGTLRSSDDPRLGVTDADGRFHFVPNTFAVGPAILPTTGSPNPMLAGVAMARRTVDRLIPAQARVEQGFTALFDGTDDAFRAWVEVGRGTFDLVEGAIVARPGDDLGLLYYPKAFGDFVLRLQFRLDRRDDNSGVFVRSRNPRLPVPRRSPPHPPGAADLYVNPAWVPVHTGFEVQIDELARGGGPDPDSRRTGAMYGIPTNQGPTGQAYRRGPDLLAGAWHEYEISVAAGPDGDVYTVLLDGQATTRFTNTDAYRGKPAGLDRESGFLGIQAHTGRVAFRHIRIKET